MMSAIYERVPDPQTTACSIVGCDQDGLLAESIKYCGLEVWVCLCPKHVVERRKLATR